MSASEIGGSGVRSGAGQRAATARQGGGTHPEGLSCLFIKQLRCAWLGRAGPGGQPGLPWPAGAGSKHGQEVAAALVASLPADAPGTHEHWAPRERSPIWTQRPGLWTNTPGYCPLCWEPARSTKGPGVQAALPGRRPSPEGSAGHCRGPRDVSHTRWSRAAQVTHRGRSEGMRPCSRLGGHLFPRAAGTGWARSDWPAQPRPRCGFIS